MPPPKQSNVWHETRMPPPKQSNVWHETRMPPPKHINVLTSFDFACQVVDAFEDTGCFEKVRTVDSRLRECVQGSKSDAFEVVVYAAVVA
jgi:hypothetical protein